MKNILVTGGRGFIGRRVVEALEAQGHNVEVYDIVDGKDLLNVPGLEFAIQGKDVVFHIAAQADLTQMMSSVEHGRSGVLRNVEATHNVAYLCAKHGVWLVYASTVCVYGDQRAHPSGEDYSLPKPPELYACSKYAGEWLVKGYGYNYQMPWTILRFATIYGPGMRPALGMHVFFSQAMRGVPITVHGDGEQDRTLTYVDDLVEGIVSVLDHKEQANGEVINLSSSEIISANKMAEDVRALVGTSDTQVPIVHITQRPNNTQHEDFDVSKALSILGWSAKTSWQDGLRKTYEWMKTRPHSE